MTEFTHEPFEKIIIKNLVQETLKNFLYQCYSCHAPDAIWVDGILMYPHRYKSGTSTREYDDMVKGIKYYETLYFVKFPKYKLTLKWKEGGSYEVRLLHYNNNPQIRELAKWIKSQPIWNTVPEKTEGDDIEIDE